VTPDVLGVSLRDVQVDFYRDDESRVSGWEAVRGKRTRIPGSVMGLGRGVISHDLAQYVIEAATAVTRRDLQEHRAAQNQTRASGDR
jgi:hypothetical protein